MSARDIMLDASRRHDTDCPSFRTNETWVRERECLRLVGGRLRLGGAFFKTERDRFDGINVGPVNVTCS